MKPHRNTGRIVTIMEALAAAPAGLTLSALVELLDAPRSSVHQLMQGLLSIGYAAMDSGRYVVGPALRALAGRPGLAIRPSTLRRDLQPLADDTGETVIFGVLAGLDVIYVEQIESTHVIRYVAPLYRRKSLVNTAMGKAMLAALPESEVRRLVLHSSAFDSVDRDGYIKELDQVRRDGVSYNRGNTVAGVYAAASCVRDGAGRAFGAVSVVGPESRMATCLEAHAAQVINTARQISVNPGRASDG
jgi:DNA-binding IclR family transcriptional regulator